MIQIENVTFSYPDSSEPAIRNISIEIREGEFILIVGKSGCGKSTLCRTLNGLVPHFYGGTFSGSVTIDGIDTKKTSPSKLAGTIGMIFQDPENQLVMTNVENELAFGLENIGLPVEKIRERIEQYISYFGLRNFGNRFIPELSGGEKQKVALASILAMQPKYLILDEPTSQLDGENAQAFLESIKNLNVSMGITIILVEHRLERCLQYADRVIFMKNGKVEFDGKREEAIPYLKREKIIYPFSRTVDQLNPHQEVILEANDIWFSYGNSHVLRGLNLSARKGEILAITGANGSGKSTLLKNLNGLLKPEKGSVYLFGKNVSGRSTAELASLIGYLSQNPNDYLFEKNLQKELEFTLTNLRIAKTEWEERISWTLSILDLSKYRKTFPRDLSCGERERAALASILVAKPRILALDEPTRGLDQWNKAKLGQILKSLQREGVTTIIVTHDLRFIAEYASRVLKLHDGRLYEIPIDHIYPAVTGNNGGIIAS
ncbi:MAG: energy-coupling factor transporter ATPase [Methanomassiliicoccales archaeon]|jgi:energy-coupling factor transport system ATP-binding protein|nr:energy-coupling factor transporter ATPase [Methanomassiliicoccales archaeon]